MKLILVLILLVLSASPVLALEVSAERELYDRLLTETVKDGVVDYGALSGRYSDLQQYLNFLAKNPYSTLSDQEKLAVGINAYNAHCINGVLKAGKIASVKDVWFFFKRTDFVLGGEEMDLDHLEHEILRKLGDPRIHFALVCASKSCPLLSSSVYRVETLDQDLDAKAREFVQDKTKNRVDHEAGVVYLSSIFNWFKDDFTQKAASLIDYIKPYLTEEDRQYLETNKVTVKFLDYDWNLNGHF